MSERSLILIVDDQLSVRKQVAALLKDDDLDLQLLASGRELLEQLPNLNADLIILDVLMPEVDGFEVCWYIKSNPKLQHIPIILLTSLDSKEVLTQGLDAGADDFVQKPPARLELRSRVRSMLRIKRQYDALEAALKMREELSNMVIHDMSSPITSMLLHSTLMEEQIRDESWHQQRQDFADLLKESKLDNQLSTTLHELLLKLDTMDTALLKHLEMVHMEADRLDSFVNDMLMVAKMEQSKLLINPSMVNIIKLAQTAEKHFSIIAQSRNMRLKLELPEQDRLELSLDSQLFSRVIANLLANAFKYAPSDSTVTLKLEVMPTRMGLNHMRLKVIDEGPGVPAEYRQRIFEKFEVVKLRSQGVSQTGLGLAFCKMVVDAHQGSIYVESNHPQGSVFIVEL